MSDDQSAMQAYVRARLAGTQAAPVPAQDPAVGYVTAQMGVPPWNSRTPWDSTPRASSGARVPPPSMNDAFDLDMPEIGDERTTMIKPSYPGRDQANAVFQAQVDQLRQQQQALRAQLETLPVGSRERNAAYDQISALHDQLMQLYDNSPTAQLMQRRGIEDQAINQGPGQDANVIRQAMLNYQDAPREPLPPPAPGGQNYQRPMPVPPIPPRNPP